jgi:pyruvate/2-oxoglutarate dehydrogenase complex dihydrolipoamide acyltransferase (E2) component
LEKGAETHFCQLELAMTRRTLRAIGRCGPHAKGSTFTEPAHIAKVFVALGRAAYIETSSQDYMTRDMRADESATKPVDAAVDIVVSYSVRAFAAENGVHLGVVTGTGVNGRILKGDVQAVIDNQGDA